MALNETREAIWLSVTLKEQAVSSPLPFRPTRESVRSCAKRDRCPSFKRGPVAHKATVTRPGDALLPLAGIRYRGKAFPKSGLLPFSFLLLIQLAYLLLGTWPPACAA
jgi:hypothetical protein